MMYCFADYHTHTKHSHGSGTVRENVAAAVSRGLEMIAISDHGPNHLFGYGIKSLKVLEIIRAELREASKEFPQVQGLVGIEANIISVRGDLDLPPEKSNLVDFILANIHAMVRPKTMCDALSIWGYHYGKNVFSALEKRSVAVNTEATINALAHNKIDVLTHPGVRFAIDYTAVAQACAFYGTAFELNASKAYLTPQLVEVVAKEGALFMLGSDAHSPERVGDFAPALALAKQVGLTSAQIINVRDTKG